MYEIKLIPMTGKWKVTLPDGTIMGDKYNSAYQASMKLTKYLKGQK